MKKILFFSTGNSSRSQMAEGFARKYYGDKFQIYSAGGESRGVSFYAMQAMNLLDVDISMQHSKSIQDFPPMSFDYVLTLCDYAPQHRPFFSGSKHIHYAFKEPYFMAKKCTNETDRLRCFVQIAYEIEHFVKSLPTLFPEIFAE